jgi:hypothetical protein
MKQVNVFYLCRCRATTPDNGSAHNEPSQQPNTSEKLFEYYNTSLRIFCMENAKRFLILGL